MLEQQRQSQTAYLSATLVEAQDDDVLELDEVWAFVGNKKNHVWIWLALCRLTRQVVAWHYGPRDEISCQLLWAKVPKNYKTKMCYSDFWHSYEKVLPKEQHQACGKNEGQTIHVERFNLTLRQRVSRLVRKTLSYSKNLLWLIRHMRLFLIRYNCERKRILARP
ncbi:MAG: IS1 family transposase [Proteobacteria bacterium]|nr:MAG: IS1 family transposase [Pseudomonadota bacterium]